MTGLQRFPVNPGSVSGSRIRRDDYNETWVSLIKLETITKFVTVSGITKFN